jgi:NAD(P)-dependent dehydrogenase (short-subunit alcohol dehydrogenase family)
MLLDNKNAVIYGAGGAIGGAVARAFAREGANVFLAGRTLASLDAVAKDIRAHGGRADATQVDALDEAAVEAHLRTVVEKAGRIDVSFNATGMPQEGVQGIPLVELSSEAYTHPVTTYTRAHFVTARAAARRMLGERSGVILTLTASPVRGAAPLLGGMTAAWAAIEALTRGLSAELGPHGIRVLGLRPDGIPETATIRQVYGLHARAAGMTREQFQALMESLTHVRRLPTLAEVANVAAFLASDQSRPMTGTVANLSGGSAAD